MKPERIRGMFKRRKRDHKIKCLRCLQVFLSYCLKTNRICAKCKHDSSWKEGLDYTEPEIE